MKNLEIGATYKFKELCQIILGEEPKTGNSKIRQVKEIDSVVKYDRKGYSYIITEITGTEITKAVSVIGRKAFSEDEYKAVARNIAKTLKNHATNEVFLSINQLGKASGLVQSSKEFIVNSRKSGKFNNVELTRSQLVNQVSSIELDNKNIIEKFLTEVTRCYSSYALTALKTLRDMGLVEFTEETSIVVSTGHRSTATITANDKQLALISKVRKDVMAEQSASQGKYFFNKYVRESVDEAVKMTIRKIAKYSDDKDIKQLNQFVFAYKGYEITVNEGIKEFAAEKSDINTVDLFANKMIEKAESLGADEDTYNAIVKLMNMLCEDLLEEYVIGKAVCIRKSTNTFTENLAVANGLYGESGMQDMVYGDFMFSDDFIGNLFL